MEYEGRDEFLEERLARYERWVSEGKVPTASKVIPINESLGSLQWVLPTNQVIEILRNARSFALKNCGCRTKYQRCDNPVDVCFVINDAADRWVQNREAKYINLDEAIEKLKLANKHGLVHLTIYNPEQHIFALCSCCECCCHDLQIMKKFQRPDFIAHSDYIAGIDPTTCINCSKCVDRCLFNALKVRDSLEFHAERCYGCGLCVTTCPTNSITLKLRKFDIKE